MLDQEKSPKQISLLSHGEHFREILSKILSNMLTNIKLGKYVKHASLLIQRINYSYKEK
jgi:hypothetical protein